LKVHFPTESPQQIADFLRANGFEGASIIPIASRGQEVRIIQERPDRQIWANRIQQLRQLPAGEVPAKGWGNLAQQGAEAPDTGREGSARSYRRSIQEAGVQIPESVRLDGDIGKLAEENGRRLREAVSVAERPAEEGPEPQTPGSRVGFMPDIEEPAPGKKKKAVEAWTKIKAGPDHPGRILSPQEQEALNRMKASAQAAFDEYPETPLSGASLASGEARLPEGIKNK